VKLIKSLITGAKAPSIQDTDVENYDFVKPREMAGAKRHRKVLSADGKNL